MELGLIIKHVFKKQKGIVNIIYIMGLIVMFLILVTYITFSYSRPKIDKVEIAVNNTIYLSRDSLDIAKLYLETALRYSIFQAMHDSGEKGGFEDIESGRSFEHDGVAYALWYNGIDLSPSEDDVTSALGGALTTNFEKYTSAGSLVSLFVVQIPGYSSVTVTNLNDYSVRLESFGDSDLSLKKTLDNGEVISMEKSSDINMTVYAPYFMLYREAMIYHKMLLEKNLSESCEKAEIGKTNEDMGCCTFDAEILDNSGGDCLVKVEAATKKKFLVRDDDKTLLKEIRLVFMERHLENQS